jgi:hypothetical protein
MTSATHHRTHAVWTVWVEYSATGEGRTLMARVAHAPSAKKAIEAFGKAFDPYFAQGADVAAGVLANGVTTFLFSPAALDRARALAGKAHLVIEGRYHLRPCVAGLNTASSNLPLSRLPPRPLRGLAALQGGRAKTALPDSRSQTLRRKFGIARRTRCRRNAINTRGQRPPASELTSGPPVLDLNCSKFPRASSTSMAGYRSVDAIPEWPSGRCKARPGSSRRGRRSASCS